MSNLGLNFANRLAEARRRKGWKQPDLAAATGIKLQTVQNWEQRRCEPSFKDIERLSDALSVEPYTLFQAKEDIRVLTHDDAVALVQTVKSLLRILERQRPKDFSSKTCEELLRAVDSR